MVNDKMKIESIWEKFKSGIKSTMDSYIPSKNFKKKKTQFPGLIKIKENDKKERPPLQTCKKNPNNGQNSKITKNYVKEFKNAEMDYVNKTIQEGLENNNSNPF